MWRAGRRWFSLAAPQAEPSIVDKIFSRSTMPRTPLDVPVPHAIRPEPIRKQPTQVTTLENGLRVVSVNSSSPIVTLGVVVDSGSRYETPPTSGISHFMEYIAFGSSSKRPDYQFIRDMLQIGVNNVCTTSREHTLYFADCLPEHLPRALQGLADVTTDAVFDPWEIDEIKPRYKAVIQEKASKPDVQLVEAIHAAAYHNNTLGLPLFPTEKNVDSFDQAKLKAHYNAFFSPQRMVVTGVGVEHSELVGLARESFKKARGQDIKTQPAQYTGGEIRTPSETDMLHFGLAFETASFSNLKELVPMCVLQLLMGGGGSFSAGGPGKGMCSRLYLNVLNQHSWVEATNCFNSIYSDSSLFGITGMCPGDKASDLVKTLCDEFHGMRKVETSEVQRAKNQLKASVLMTLETRAGQAEDHGRQLLTYNRVETGEQLCAQIDAVTPADVGRIAEKMQKTRPSMAALGNVSYMPRYEEVCRRFG